MHRLVLEGYIPPATSKIMRLVNRDLFTGHAQDSINLLNKQRNLGDDLSALLGALYGWTSGNDTIYVGESATLYRILQFKSWKDNLGKIFIKDGTLKTRKICDDSSIVSYSQEELLKLPEGTTQWATAKVLYGDKERIPNPPYQLQLTYDVMDYWEDLRQKGKMWKWPNYDETILRQAETYLKLLKRKKKRPRFIPQHSEDYCFARAFDYITQEEGKARWPQLEWHESNRIIEMEEALHDVLRSHPIESLDHRIVEAATMYAIFNRIPFSVLHPKAVNKKWPQFWKFIQSTKF